MPGAKYELQRKCEICGCTFLARTIESKYCSRKCINKAYNIRKKESQKQKELEVLAEKGLDNASDLISVKEAESIFCVSAKTIHSLIRKGRIWSVNLGERLTKVSRNELMGKLPLRAEPIDRSVALPKLYSLEPDDCYTIGEVTEKYKVSEKTVYEAIRKYGIPMRQLGKYVYVPKSEIDKLFKNGQMV